LLLSLLSMGPGLALVKGIHYIYICGCSRVSRQRADIVERAHVLQGAFHVD
jgi:hypothetical protein